MISAFCSSGYGQDEIMIGPVGSVTSVWVTSKDDTLREGILKAVGDYNIVMVDRLTDIAEEEYHTDIIITEQDFGIKNDRGYLMIKYYGKYTFTCVPKSIYYLREKRKTEIDVIAGLIGTRMEITKFREGHQTLEFYQRKWKPMSGNENPSYIIIRDDGIVGVNVELLAE